MTNEEGPNIGWAVAKASVGTGQETVAAYLEGAAARRQGAVRMAPPDEIAPEGWLRGYDEASSFADDRSPPIPGEVWRPLPKAIPPELLVTQDEPNSEPGIPSPVVPDWAKERHPRSLLASKDILRNPDAEELFEVWRHDGLLTIVAKPGAERDDEAWAMMERAASFIASVERGRPGPAREMRFPVVADGIWASVLNRHLKRVLARFERAPGSIKAPQSSSPVDEQD